MNSDNKNEAQRKSIDKEILAILNSSSEENFEGDSFV